MIYRTISTDIDYSVYMSKCQYLFLKNGKIIFNNFKIIFNWVKAQ